MAHDHNELWKRFQDTGAERFATFTDWALGAGLPGRLGAYYAEKGESTWWAATFRTFRALKLRGVDYMAKALAFPEARTFADLFEAARYAPAGPDAKEPQPLGWCSMSGHRAAGAAPCGHVGGARKWADSGHRWRSGQFHMTYAKPRESVLRWWGDNIVSRALEDQEWGLSSFDLVQHENGRILVIACSRNSISHRWVAYLDAGESLVPLMSDDDRATLEREAAADLEAWGGFTRKPELYEVRGEDRAMNALGVGEPFRLTVLAESADDARERAAKSRREVCRDHVHVHEVRPAGAGGGDFLEPLREAGRRGVPLAEVGAEPAPGAKVDSDVLEVLKAAYTHGNALELRGELERRLYERTDKVLRALGGRWSKRVRAHVFEDDAGELLASVLASGRYVDARKVRQAFYTPQDLARRVVAAADISAGLTVLEPSAGGGALAKAAREAGGLVTCMEIDAREAAKLEAAGFVCAVGDFLAEPPDAFDRVVMNPPFSGGQDVRHVRHAAQFVRPGGRLVAIMSPGFKFRTCEPYASFRAWLEAQDAEISDIPAGAFAEAGTQIATVLVAVNL